MTTTTPLLKAHPPSRRALTVALAFGAGTALGVAGMALISRDHTVTRVRAWSPPPRRHRLPSTAASPPSTTATS